MPSILLIFFIYLYGSGTFQIPLWLALLGGLESEFVHVYTQVFSQCLKNLMKTQLSPALSQELPLRHIKMTHQKAFIQQQLQHQFTGFPRNNFYQIGKVLNLKLNISDNFWLGPHPLGAESDIKQEVFKTTYTQAYPTNFYFPFSTIIKQNSLLYSSS